MTHAPRELNHDAETGVDGAIPPTGHGSRGAPVPMVLRCPTCGGVHVDRDEWATRPHRTHLCEHCGGKWQPHDFPTVGVLCPSRPASRPASRGAPRKTLRVRIPIVLDVSLRVPDDALALDDFARGLRSRLEVYSDGRRPVALKAFESLVEPFLADVAVEAVARAMLRAGQRNDGSAFRIAEAVLGHVSGSARAFVHAGYNDPDPTLDADFATSTSDPTSST